MGYEVGQKVYVLPYGFEHGKAKRTGRGMPTHLAVGEVVKVARVRVTVRVQGQDVQFDGATGRECVRDFARKIQTDAQFAELEHRDELLARLRPLRELGSRGMDSYSTHKLEALLAVVEADI